MIFTGLGLDVDQAKFGRSRNRHDLFFQFFIVLNLEIYQKKNQKLMLLFMGQVELGDKIIFI